MLNLDIPESTTPGVHTVTVEIVVGSDIAASESEKVVIDRQDV